ncbi:Formate hydrogenlyase transcriptional activator [Pseudobythopirellula maris]|uniref:Formate hydrogenlyase transcriptional activator n=1 Tax=Pseudobythopirellula maris TaxID=2527991 RepID=A0A5C5ZRD7_9BACT|nr:sigma 54-interacting transcriptional regulator [Pseudobythopirellula maris]TWT89645.1 Formate hydrogenlyase transcriptional activator [Pseudobythopirellula maris]
MPSRDENPTLLDDPKSLLLELAQQRELPQLLDLLVSRIAASDQIALARLWLVRPGEGCETCPMRDECPDRSQCLHLVASSGRSVVDPSQDLSRLDGRFRRFPIGVRKVGRIAMTGEAIEAPDMAELPSWVAQPAWVRDEGIIGFAGQPLSHHGMVLGVLGVFTRARIGEGCLDWLRMIADHAAVAIAHTHAWEEVERLRKRLEEENEYLQQEAAAEQGFGEMLGVSPALRNVSQQIDLVAPTDSTVLILGESGVGKEVVAREVHRRSNRADRPLIKVNCAAIPRELFESEFFGHIQGAFTGALRDRAGRFELADGGTLFLDEVGEVPLDLQSKLLRVLQEGEIERIGEEQTRRVDVRIIAATNRDLREESRQKRFREDLYYRLSVFPIEMPPLRQRRDDVAVLAEHFLRQASQRLATEPPRLTTAVSRRLERYDWPGNVRELQHVIERAVILSRGGALRVDLREPTNRSQPSPAPAEGEILTDAQIRQLERDNLERALRASDGKIHGPEGAAELLGVKPTTLSSRLRAMGIKRR